ncbi:HNH endonuclease [Caballeronia sp. M1242]|uniref:HNH endonuclease n=1 Tax=Caballeronia sp. M1242 TaxID=2814653 RepID=UPI0019CF8628|nr:HNH endonuclease [Caballeronia sp. M1242]
MNPSNLSEEELANRWAISVLSLRSLRSRGTTPRCHRAKGIVRYSAKDVRQFEDEEFLKSESQLRTTRSYGSRQPQREWSATRDRIFKRDAYTCLYCGTTEGPLEVDHIIARSLGGSHEDSNLATSCRTCNRAKAAMSIKEWYARGGRLKTIALQFCSAYS